MFRPFRVNLAGLSSLAKQGRALDSPVSDSKPHRNRASSFALTMRRAQLSAVDLLEGHFWSPMAGVARLSLTP